MNQNNGRKSNVWKGIAAGMVGGLVASWTMNQFQALASKATEPGGQKPRGDGGDNATVKAASAVSENVMHHHLTDDEKKTAGPAVHYAFGSVNGAIYGALTELKPGISLGGGSVFGGLLWVLADEIGVPAFGLSQPPTQTPVSSHAEALAAHLVYGLTTDAVKRAVRAVL